MKKLPPQSHERMVHVFGYLADFAEAYPRLCEGEQRMYRDLARAAMTSLADEQACAAMCLAPDIEKVIAPMVRAQVLAERLRRKKAREARENNVPVGQLPPSAVSA